MDHTIIYSPSDFVDVFNQSVDYAFPVVVVEGEVSSFRIAKDRWVYFDIKDESATLRCFGTVYMLPGPIEDGMLLQIVANPRLHAQYNFSLNVQSMTAVGEGAIARQAELVRQKLEAEGLFLAERKRQLPYPPESVALVTSVESAAYADFVKITSERWPLMRIDAYNTLVQGVDAPGQLVEAIARANQSGVNYGALVVVRGGGSAEDLAAFSDERVVRAVAGSRIPTMVAIGHEVDESLAELAADASASTPSNAAELLVPDRSTVQSELAVARKSLAGHLQHIGWRASSRLAEERHVLNRALLSLFAHERQTLGHLVEKLELLSPTSVLARGYALIRGGDGVIRSVSQLTTGQEVAIIVADGQRKAKIL